MDIENADLENNESSSNTALAIAGDYDFSIGEVITESWNKVNGLKGPFWLAAIILFGIVFIGGLALGGIANFVGLVNIANLGFAVPILMQIAMMALMYPFIAGIVMLGIRRSVDLPLSYNEIFAYFAYVVPLLVAAILMTICMMLGFMLLIIPGIYLSVAYMFTVPLIVEKNLGAWEAMETSRKAVTRHWFKFFVTLIIMTVVFIVSAIPLGIGLIWTYPMFIAVMGVLYRETFGVEQSQ